MSHSHGEHLTPVGGKVLTVPFKLLAGIFVLSVLTAVWRWAVGLGEATAMSDGYPWGAWKVFNVIVLTAFGSGGYVTAFVVYALNRMHYHPLVRTAILTSALGYTAGILCLGIDLGRPWNFWRLAVVPAWNLHSVLLEVAVCISIYLMFLWIEASPPFLEAWVKGPEGWLKRIAVLATPVIDRLFPWLLAGAIVLPSMHQSSLGALYLLAGPKVHPLWQTPLLPLLFLLSCWALGLAAVILVSLLSSLTWSRPLHMNMLHPLSRITAGLLLTFAAVRLGDLIWHGELARAFAFDTMSWLFMTELVLIVAPALAILARPALPPGPLMRAVLGAAIGGGLYRLDAALIAYHPLVGRWTYFPSIPEMIVTVGFVSLAVLAYIFIVKRYAILAAPEPHPARN